MLSGTGEEQGGGEGREGESAVREIGYLELPTWCERGRREGKEGKERR